MARRIGPAKLPGQRPSTLAGAIESSERDVLLVLRRKLADRLDSNVPLYILSELVREFHRIDAALRSLDARAEAEAADEGKPASGAWDPDAI
jgi:hypothetical protein